MTQSVELLLDPSSDAAVRAEWAALRAAGLPSEQRSATSDHHRPHITLYAGDALSAGADGALPALVAGMSLELRLGALMLFGPHRERFVLVHQVVPSGTLLDLQQRVAEVCGADASGYFGPGRWSPHVTLARRVPPSDLPEVLHALEPGSAVGRTVEVTACRRWDSETRPTWLL